MTGIKRSSVALLSVLVFSSGLQTASAVEKPVILPDAALSVTISDFHGFIDGVGLIAAKANPQINGMMLKLMLGMQIGDPGLAGIAPGKGLSIVAMDTTNIFAVVEVSEAQAPVYANLATARGMQSSYTNDVLVIGQTVELVTEGIKRSNDVKSSLLSKRSPALCIASQPAEVIAKNNELIQGYLKSLPMMMQSGLMQAPGADTNAAASTAKILEAELVVLLSLAEQCETLEIALSPANGALQLSETFVPVAGTDLAKLVNAPKTAKANEKIQAGLLGEGLFMFDIMFANSEAFTEFFGAELVKMVKAADLKELDAEAIIKMSEKWMQVYSGSISEMVAVDPDTGLEAAVLMEMSDEQTMVDLFKSYSTDMAPLLKIYEDLGVPLTIEFKEKVREYNGISIHKLHIVIDFQDMPEEQIAQLKEMKLDDMTYELAFFDGLVLYYMGGQKLEALIDRVKSDVAVEPLKARSVYPEGGFYYFDFDTAQYLELISAFVPPEQQSPVMPQLIALMQGADPVTAAGFREDGCVKCSINFPGDMIGKLGQIGMMMQMQQQPAPAGMPQAAPMP